MKHIAILLCLIASASCVTDDDEVTSTLVAEGYSDVKPGDWAMFGCGEHDKKGRRFVAKNPVGVEVSGVVCCGILKGCTVRH